MAFETSMRESDSLFEREVLHWALGFSFSMLVQTENRNAETVNYIVHKTRNYTKKERERECYKTLPFKRPLIVQRTTITQVVPTT